ncbi:glycosyltransferase (group I) [Methanosarcina siciliae C2J]|uniref:Glycosyltransferase (Group I) n=2 Tax=Methanosarcina siciliae TaxID=38027 RepID=A0A0E3P5P6_9EURY|nr:glycosyltransferase family 4 protein [Methanosarcina siciliae]AKB29027.1 glycosyltransferase (group I) [Methanosarcina siciliae T4/M]AKB36599.1 glycosyltransferase (group I) [Methanosarcina siciliae C2J]
MNIIIIWGMPLIEDNAQTICAIEKVRTLKKLGHEVFLISPSVPLSLYKYNQLKLPVLLLCQIPLFIKLFLKVIREKPDILHSSSALILPSLIISRAFNIPHVVEVHGILSEDSKLVGVNKFVIKLMEICEFSSYRISKLILTNSEGTKDDLIHNKKISPQKISIIPNGANIELFKKMNVSKKVLGLDEQNKYIIFVGNLAPWQGLACLVDSMPTIIQNNSGVRLLIVGDGILKNELIQRVNELKLESVVDFKGSVPYEDIPKYINASDVCVAPFIKSRDNLMSPLKLFEYLSCEVPVVTSNIRGARELIENNSCGLLFNPDDCNELAESILKLLNDKKLRDEMGKRGRAAVVSGYSWESITKKIESEYLQLI